MSNTDNLQEVTEIQQQSVPFVPHGKDEMNLAEFPIAKIGRNDKRLIIEYEGQTVDKTGTIHHQKWVVSGSAQFGLPTEFAERILVGLMTLTAQNKFADKKVPFTIYRILKLLGLTHNKRNYQAVVKALRQLVAVTISSEGAFYDKAQKKRVTTIKDFHLIEDFWLKSYEKDEGVIAQEEANGYIVWSDRLFKSFEAGYIKNLDVGFYYSLENTVARRLFRFLDKRMHYQDIYQIDIYDLVGRMGMKKSPYPSRLKNKMKSAFEELVERGFLEEYEFVKVGKYHRVKFYKAGSFRTHQTSLFDDAETLSEPSGNEIIDSQHSILENQLHLLYELHSTSEDLKTAWSQVLEELDHVLPHSTYTMIEKSALLAVEGEEAIIATKEETLVWVQVQLARKIKLNLSTVLQQTISSLSFVSLTLQ